jgi:hypothetical protein
LSKEFNHSHKISELSDVEALDNAIDALNDADNHVSFSNKNFVNALHKSINHTSLKPSPSYTARSKAYLMHKYGEEQSKRNALISFVNVKEHFIDLSKILVRSTVLAPVAAAVVFAFIGGYLFGNTTLMNEDVQTTQVINVKSNLNTIVSSPEIQNTDSNLPGIVMTTDIVEPSTSPVDNQVNNIQSSASDNAKTPQSNIAANVVNSEIQAQLDSLQLSLVAIAALADSDQPIDSAALHSISGNLHAITSYIQNTEKIAPTFVMQFLETSTGVRSSLATAGNDANDIAYIATEIATQEGIIGVAKYFDSHPNALAIYAANNW